MFELKLGVPRILFVSDKKFITETVKSVKWNLIITNSCDFSLQEAFGAKQITSLEELRLEKLSSQPVKCVYLCNNESNTDDLDSIAEDEEGIENLLQYIGNRQIIQRITQDIALKTGNKKALYSV
jgi:hypothetical protein